MIVAETSAELLANIRVWLLLRLAVLLSRIVEALMVRESVA